MKTRLDFNQGILNEELVRADSQPFRLKFELKGKVKCATCLGGQPIFAPII